MRGHKSPLFLPAASFPAPTRFLFRPARSLAHARPCRVGEKNERGHACACEKQGRRGPLENDHCVSRRTNPTEISTAGREGEASPAASPVNECLTSGTTTIRPQSKNAGRASIAACYPVCASRARPPQLSANSHCPQGVPLPRSRRMRIRCMGNSSLDYKVSCFRVRPAAKGGRC